MPKSAQRAAPAVVTANILIAAARLFRERGVAGTPTREIAKAAGVLPGSLHYRYPTKERLLLAVLERAMAQLTASVERAVAISRDPMTRLRLALRAHLRDLLGADDSVYVLLYEWRALSDAAMEEWLATRRRYEQLFVQLLDEAVAVLPLRREVDLFLLRQFVFGAVNQVAMWRRPGGPSIERIADQFFRLVAFGALDLAPLPLPPLPPDPGVPACD